MKKFLLFSLLAFLLFACHDQANDKKTSFEKPAPRVMDTVLIYVLGMHCDGCENTIQNSIAALPGVDSVKAGHINGYTVVIFDTLQSNYKDFSKVILDKGYQVDGYCTDINLKELIIE